MLKIFSLTSSFFFLLVFALFKQFLHSPPAHAHTCSDCAAAPGFNSLIPAPSVPSLISTEPVELLCRASNISSRDPFCFVKQKHKTIKAFLQFFIYKYLQLRPACAERKFTAIKATTQPRFFRFRADNVAGKKKDFPQISFPRSYTISLLKIGFVTLFLIRFSKKLQKITLISSRIGRCKLCTLILEFFDPKRVKHTKNTVADDKNCQIFNRHVQKLTTLKSN